MQHFLEVDSARHCKYGQIACGDVFISKKIRSEGRTIAVLSDGLGSGIKASVLASLTATMAGKFIANYRDVQHTASIIMSTLPVCSVRQIRYATFSIVDMKNNGETAIMEFDNPAVLVMRDGARLPLKQKYIALESGNHDLRMSHFTALPGDRIIMFSDGVTQAGMGHPSRPFGWQEAGVEAHIISTLYSQPEISARDLSAAITAEARRIDGAKPGDDTTCGVLYLRKPRKLLVVSGPPYEPRMDAELAEIVAAFGGTKAVCGGTTANIIARELGRTLNVHLDSAAPGVPPCSSMAGIELITEGILTLGRVAEMLDTGCGKERHGAAQLYHALVNNDIIEFIVGTRINEAHQDPNIPVELEIRRNVVKRIVRTLEERYLKEVRLRYI